MYAELEEQISTFVGQIAPELLDIRRNIHMHPELGYTETLTTQLVADRLSAAGLQPVLLEGTGLYCDIGAGNKTERIALRADLDGLPIPETTGLPFSSQVSGVSHACGHDVHTALVLGAGLALAEISDQLPAPVRLIFQPAEEVQPGGAISVVKQGVLRGVSQIYAVHCDPSVDVGFIGSRIGALTSASDAIRVRLQGSGGHTSRPHMTQDLIYILAQIIVQTQAVVGRRLDPRAGVNMTWGMIQGGGAPNAIPAEVSLQGTLRVLDADAWLTAGDIVVQIIRGIAQTYGVKVEVEHVRGVPPVVNEATCVANITAATRSIVSPQAVQLTEQSLGGEDFAWYLNEVPGAMIRLGTRTPGGRTYDLHQGDFVADERAIAIGAKILAATALRAGHTDQADLDTSQINKIPIR